MRTVAWKDKKIKIIDQTKLPRRLEYLYLKNVDELVSAINGMKVRGAPAIGAAAAFGCVLGAGKISATARRLLASRPTAVNLRWAVERMLKAAERGRGLSKKELRNLLLKEARRIADEDVAVNKKIGWEGAKIITRGMNILTVCNAGALATVDYGTALGVIRAAAEQGKAPRIFVAETRPRLQGARLTAWELKRLKLPFTLITDNMIGFFMRQGKIDLVVVGADRIARNGDTANKIGTYNAAVLARVHGIPFYVAAPFSSFDFNIASGEEIVIEERDPHEVTWIGKEPIAPAGIRVANPAFDITPAKYITGFITEKGIIKAMEIRSYGD
jgi:methylthioribose-1-phosphate isomerase